ncbi:MAG TPA: peptide deformylase [Geobacterales bacterium]|nr:peptide deformylase [Geobacterales bacterium]
MSIRPILLYPHPLLKEPTPKVVDFGPALQQGVQDLLDTMVAGPGSVGVAAPQIGLSLRLCVVDVSKHRQGKENNHGRLVIINPEILTQDGQETMREGCMSVPDYTGDVIRPNRIILRFLDEQGKSSQIEATGFEAVALQHEIDHLDGILFLDRVASLKTGLFRRKNYK